PRAEERPCVAALPRPWPRRPALPPGCDWPGPLRRTPCPVLVGPTCWPCAAWAADILFCKPASACCCGLATPPAAEFLPDARCRAEPRPAARPDPFGASGFALPWRPELLTGLPWPCPPPACRLSALPGSTRPWLCPPWPAA